MILERGLVEHELLGAGRAVARDGAVGGPRVRDDAHGDDVPEVTDGTLDRVWRRYREHDAVLWGERGGEEKAWVRRMDGGSMSMMREAERRGTGREGGKEGSGGKGRTVP